MLRLVGEQRRRLESGAIHLNAQQIIALPGWGSRVQRRHSDVFPVHVDRYEPLTGAVEALDTAIARASHGYVALVGPPGSGKSTLLSQALSGVGARVVRYLAFVPNDPGSRFGRTTPSDFLHDVVLALHSAGLRTRVSLPELADTELRTRFAEQLLAANEDFTSTGRRTIIVVDGLDHVIRENPTPENMLRELPDPDVIREGVLLVIGAQSIGPAGVRAQEHLHAEPWRMVDLKDYRLPPAAVGAICRRLALELTTEQVSRISELSDGHPLALDYILNDLVVGDVDPSVVLGRTPLYTGDIRQQYSAYWADLVKHPAMEELLATVARLQPPIDMTWVQSFTDPAAYRTLRERLRHLFRGSQPRRWRIFHDSFRQYMIERTSLDLDGQIDPGVDVAHHRRLADQAAASPDRQIRLREIHHAAQAGQWDRVLGAGSQAEFRQQFLDGRAPSLIARDLGLYQRAAAERGDVVSLAAGVLAAAELDYRRSFLAETNVPGAMLDAGLVDAAADYLDPDSGGATRVPTWQALDTAARLAVRGRPEAQQIFDAVDPPDLLEHRTDGSMGRVIDAWAAAAPWIRPASAVERVIEGLISRSREAGGRGDEAPWRDREAQLRPVLAAVTIAKATIIAMRRRGRDEDEARFEQVLNAHCTAGDTPGAALDVQDEMALHAQEALVQVLSGRIAEALGIEDWQAAHQAVLAMHDFMRGRQTTVDSLLTLSEAALKVSGQIRHTDPDASDECRDIAARGDSALEPPKALSVSRFGMQSTVELHREFRRRRLSVAVSAAHPDRPPLWEAVAQAASAPPPPPERPAGADLDSNAAVQQDREAIELAARVDDVVTRLAAMAGSRTAGLPIPEDNVRVLLDRLLTCYPTDRSSPTGSAWSVAGSRQQVFELAIDVLAGFSDAAAARLAERLGRHFDNARKAWAPSIRQRLGLSFHERGIRAPWLREAMEQADAETLADTSVSDRLESLVTQAKAHAAVDDESGARAFVLRLLPESFGVHGRKDYQVPSLMQFMAAADGLDVVDEAECLAPYLAATIEWTEGSASDACSRLLELVAMRNPSAAVRLMAWFYGTVAKEDYDDLVASLFAGLARRVASCDDEDTDAAVDLLADAIGRMLVPFAYAPTDMLASALEELSSGFRDIVDAVLIPHIETRALPGVRGDWLGAIGQDQAQPSAVDDAEGATGRDDFGDLVLADERIPRSVAGNRLKSIEDVLNLRLAEQSDSHFRWEPHVRRLASTLEDVAALAEVMTTASDAAAVHLTLADVSAVLGNRTTATRLAEHALALSRPEAWGPAWGSDRLRSYEMLMKVADAGRRPEIARRVAGDIVGYLGAHTWAPSQTIDELARLVEVLDPEHDRAAMWGEVRLYLDGMVAAAPSLARPNLSAEVRASWWTGRTFPISAHDEAQPQSGAAADVILALTEFALLFLDHPHWGLREGATDVLSRAVGKGSHPTLSRVTQLLEDQSPDPVLVRGTPAPVDGTTPRWELVVDAAARAVVHAAENVELVDRAARIIDMVRRASSSTSVMARHLSRSSFPELVPAPPPPGLLPAVYRLELPPEDDDADVQSLGGPLGGPPTVVLGPYGRVVAEAASLAGADPDLALHRAVAIARAVAAVRADPDRFRDIGPEDSYLPTAGAAIRCAALTVIDELDSSGQLPAAFASGLCDPDLVDISYAPRPLSYPPGEHGRLLERLVPGDWAARVDARLAEIAAAMDSDHVFLLGAIVEELPLEHGQWSENYRCVSWTEPRSLQLPEPLAAPPPLRQAPMKKHHLQLREAFATVNPVQMRPGTALVVENQSFLLHSLAANWMALRPDVGAACGWRPDLREKLWRTANGDVTARLVFWQDGHVYRSSRADDNTVGRGVAVVATALGVDQLTHHGGIVRRHSVDRVVTVDGTEFERTANSEAPVLR